MKTATQAVDVFLLAESRFVREALASVLAGKNDLRVVAALAFGPGVLQEISELKPRVLVVESAVCAVAGLQVIASLREAFPLMKVVMIGMDADTDMFVRCVKAGVVGYLLKDASALDIVSAVKAIASEEAACPPRLCFALFDYLARQTHYLPDVFGKRQLGLSRREQQLVDLITSGLTNKEIASRLNLSEQTVKNHVHHILRKLGVRDRFSAAEYYREQTLLCESAPLRKAQ